MPFMFKAVIAFIKTLISELLMVPSRALDAVRAAHTEYARSQVVRVIMKPNWSEYADKAYLLRCALQAERVVLVDWHYEWEAAHLYAPGATVPMVIQLVEDVYRVCDVARESERTMDPQTAITLV